VSVQELIEVNQGYLVRGNDVTGQDRCGLRRIGHAIGELVCATRAI
jgi:hypothetical protein